MKRAMVCAALLILIAWPALAQDLAQTAGGKARVILDNEKVRVIELSVAPGEKTGMHSHGDNIVYWLTPSHGVQTMADGTSKPMERKAGEILWSGPVVHDTENTGKAATKVLVIEMKAAAAD